MDILILIVAVWAGFFLLTLACAATKNRARATAAGASPVDFRVQPLLLPDNAERFKPLRELVLSRVDSGSEDHFAKAQN